MQFNEVQFVSFQFISVASYAPQNSLQELCAYLRGIAEVKCCDVRFVRSYLEQIDQVGDEVLNREEPIITRAA